MTLQPHGWESRLLSLAYEALHPVRPTAPEAVFDATLMEQAYAHCSALTAKHSRSFYKGSDFIEPQFVVKYRHNDHTQNRTDPQESTR